EAKANVLQKLDEVPGYPNAVLQPVVDDVDPESTDWIAWIGLSSTYPEFDATTLFDFMERRLKPRFERLPGVADVGIRGARPAEVQIRVDPIALAQRGVTYQQLLASIRNSNANFSAGNLVEGKRDVRVRATGRFESPEEVLEMIVRRDDSGPVYVRDVAEVIRTYKEKQDWARARGHEMPFFNYQLERGGNLIETMRAIQAEVADMNAPGGVLEEHSKELGLNGKLELIQTYDSTTYVEDAIKLVQNNLLIGGILATLTLLFFLRSLRTVGVIAIAIPISVIGAVVVLVALGRSVNIISLAGMAFAVGMVVDNAIVVIENIFRHLEMGKGARRAASEGAREVGGAVLASTVTTLVVFFPILLIQEAAGQLFKDIAYAIMAAVGLSLLVSLTVIPTAAARMLHRGDSLQEDNDEKPKRRGPFALVLHPFRVALDSLPKLVARFVDFATRSWISRIAVVLVFMLGTLVGIRILMPPLDYLPSGNRNICFGVLIPPPGYSLEQLKEVGLRIEESIRPAWEIEDDAFTIESITRGGPNPKEDRRQPVPVFPGGPPAVMPPPLEHYFLVSFEDRMFHGAISADKKRAIDAKHVMNWATGGHNAPDTIAFAFQMPLFRIGGNTGAAIKIDLTGRSLEEVTAAAGGLMFGLMGEFGRRNLLEKPQNNYHTR
ncbi:MAG: efflux RND transporter permease subunit, partial [Verrucomicrobiota bacterium]